MGEFHYLHHQPDGTPYDDPNAMGHALVEAAARRRHPDHAARHLLPQRGVRRRRPRAPRSATTTAAPRRGPTRVAPSPRTPTDAAIGAAIHSVRAVPRDQLGTVVAAAQRTAPARPPVRAGRRERRLPRGLRPDPDAGARRRRRARAADHRRARHPPHRRRRRAARRRRRRTPASARPPSATSATASARAVALHDAGARSPSAATATP